MSFKKEKHTSHIENTPTEEPGFSTFTLFTRRDDLSSDRISPANAYSFRTTNANITAKMRWARSAFSDRLTVYPNYFWLLEKGGKQIMFVNGMVSGEDKQEKRTLINAKVDRDDKKVIKYIIPLNWQEASYETQ